MCCYLVAVITAAIAVAADTVLGVAAIGQAAVAGGQAATTVQFAALVFFAFA